MKDDLEFCLSECSGEREQQMHLAELKEVLRQQAVMTMELAEKEQHATSTNSNDN